MGSPVLQVKRGMDLDIEVSKSPGVTVVAFAGETVSRDDQAKVSEVLDAALAEGERRFVFDLSAVPYLCSLGIAVLVAAHVKIGRQDGRLHLVNPRPKVMQILEMTRVASVFQTFGSVEDALNAE